MDPPNRSPALWHPAWRWLLFGAGLYIGLAAAWLGLADALLPLSAGWTPRGHLGLLVLASALAMLVLLEAAAGQARRHAAQAAASETRLHKLLGSLDGAAWLAAPDDTLLHYASPQFERLYGQAPGPQAGMPGRWQHAIHAADREAVAKALAGLEREGSASIRYRIEHPDGSQRWVHERTQILRGDDGAIIGLGGVVQDITGRHKYECPPEQTKQRLDALIESAMDAVITVDPDQRIVLFNAAAGRLLGVAPDAALGLPLERFIPQPSRSRHTQQVTRFGRDGTTRRSMGHLHTVTALHADGSEVEVEASISRCGEGANALLTAVLRDMRPQRAAEQAQLALARAEAANLAKSEFMSRMSHELRTPLNAVLGFAQLLLRDTRAPLTPAQEPRVKAIEQAGWHLLALINETLDLARIEAGQIALQMEAVDVDGVVVEARALCETLAHTHRVTMTHASCADPEARAWADRLHLRQVVLNLLSNAVKYNVVGGRVHVGVTAEAEALVVEVRDTGAGMSEQQLKHLFEPFNRLGRAGGNVEGTGIGLVITRSLVQAMKGSLGFTSQPGTGTSAVVRLPRHAASTQECPCATTCP